MTQTLFTKRLGALRPADDAAMEALEKIKAGETVRVEFKRVRNPRQHRLFFALLKIAFDNQSHYSTQEALRKAFLVHAGMFEQFTMKDGTVVATPKSMAFGNMPNDEFRTNVLKPFIAFICEHIIPGMDDVALRNEAEDIIAGRPAYVET